MSLILRKLARSSKEKPSISRGTAIRNLEILNRHILTSFAKSPVDGISPDSIEKWIFGLKDLELANKIINKNPMARVEPLSVDKFHRDLLTFEEASLLLEEINWANPFYYACNCIAVATGMRLGEIRGIISETWRGTHVDVRYSYSDRGGLGSTKMKERRIVMIPTQVADLVERIRCKTGFILSHNDGETPISGNRTTVALNNALKKIGISDDERKTRGLTFHGWHHWFNTMMRSAGCARLKNHDDDGT